MKTLLVTACPNGIASSVIAAGLVEKAAAQLSLPLASECQTEFAFTPFTPAQIDAAELVIVVGPAKNLARFVGKKLYQAPLADCFASPLALVEAASKQATVYQAPSNDGADAAATDSKPKAKIVAITACPTGVAHTFMAAEALDAYAKSQGMQIKVETRGSVGAKDRLTDADIQAADLVIIAADIEVDLARFDGKKLYKTSTGAALKKTQQEFANAFANGQIYQHTANSQATSQPAEKTGVYKHLMTGVSHMLPMVVAGGLLIALSFVFGIEASKEAGSLAAALMLIGGGSAFALMIPVLAGYIAFSIADRPGLAPGMIGGMLASSLGAGFLGGIAAGFIAGYSAKLIADKLQLPDTMTALKPILLIPLFASLCTGLVMVYVIGEPVAGIMRSLEQFLTNMGTEHAILLGILLGAMMCFDLGGPVNKAAYAFGVGLLASKSYMPMAAIMAAGMVPALGMGLATLVASRKFLAAEREAGKAALVLGLCFISEGAIPFAARDPMRVIPCCVAGGALTGALSMYFGATLMAPHGGIFVLFIPNAIQPVLPYLFAIAAGTLVTGMSYAAVKRTEQVVNA